MILFGNTNLEISVIAVILRQITARIFFYSRLF